MASEAGFVLRNFQMGKYMRMQRKGMTLVEVLIAGVILFVAAIGSLSYQYLARKQAKIAWAEMTATRTAQMVISDWKSTGGEPLNGEIGYNPYNFDSDFEYQSDGIWKVNVDKLTMYVILDRDVEATDTAAGIDLLELKVIARWRTDFADGTVGDDSPSIVLNTYIRADASGG